MVPIEWRHFSGKTVIFEPFVRKKYTALRAVYFRFKTKRLFTLLLFFIQGVIAAEVFVVVFAAADFFNVHGAIIDEQAFHRFF